MASSHIRLIQELLLGLSRPGAGSGASWASRWALFNWVGVSKVGGAALAGGDPITEELMPTGSLRSCQCFQALGIGLGVLGWFLRCFKILPGV